ncbi:MAG: CHAT domain-containing protein [Bacteroidota bacterium]
MMSSQAVIFLAFANSSTQPLEQLTEEDNQLRDLLHDRAVRQGHFHLHRESHADLDSLRRYLTEYRNQVWLFHYGGHAESDALILPSGDADAGGIARMLADQEMLKLVFLNGCSTQAQVHRLLELGVPAVIATHCPIEDTLARTFSWHVYHSLSLGATIQEAFDAGSAYVEAAGQPGPILRSLIFDEKEEVPTDTIWGLFYHPDRADVLQERLPTGMQETVAEDVDPNDLLIDAIWNALAEEGVVFTGRKTVKLSRKRMDILNNLPAPVAEHLRKLFVPLGDADEGYNKISPNRLRQLARTYQVLMELMTFTLLAQLWEQQLFEVKKNETAESNFAISEALRVNIRDFLNLPVDQRETFAFIPFIRQLRLTLDGHEVNYFVEELADMAELMAADSPFRRACSYFDFLRQRLAQQTDAQLQPEMGRLCVESEQQLAALFEELGYLGRYTLATVKQIVVQKFRHHVQPRFQHIVVRLVDLLGGMDEEKEIFLDYLDSQSVLLLKEEEEGETMPFLNLSPFIIDKNAFVDNSDVSKIYFYHHYQAHPASWAYRWVHKPSDPDLLVPGKEFGMVEEQMRAFIKHFAEG